MKLLCLLTAWLLSLGGLLQIIISIRRGWRQLRRLHQVPCSRCAYFTRSYQLKCTVHPGLACSLGAIDCRDFHPH